MFATIVMSKKKKQPKKCIEFDDNLRRKKRHKNPYRMRQRRNIAANGNRNLTASQHNSFINELNILRRRGVHEYGDRNRCQRIKAFEFKLNYITRHRGPVRLTPGILAYIEHTGYLPVDPNREISHLCGNYLCIESSHILYESHRRNKERQICHNKIKEWESRNRRNPNVNTKGKITTRLFPGFDCPHSEKCFVNFGKALVRTFERHQNKNVPESEFLKENLRRSLRIRKQKEKNNKNKNTNSVTT